MFKEFKHINKDKLIENIYKHKEALSVLYSELHEEIQYINKEHDTKGNKQHSVILELPVVLTYDDNGYLVDVIESGEALKYHYNNRVGNDSDN